MASVRTQLWVRWSVVSLVGLLSMGGLTAGCSNPGNSGPWPVEADAEGGGDSTTEGDAGPGTDVNCPEPEEPECQGGTVYTTRNDDGCPEKRCQCSDREVYHQPSGRCVPNTGLRKPGSPCDDERTCSETLACIEQFVGREGSGTCVPTCNATRPERCPEGWSCFVPGATAGFCLPNCECSDAACYGNQRCVAAGTRGGDVCMKADPSQSYPDCDRGD
ncbi:MAG: hypothetical protein ABEL76_14870 [Bradymonadaceae bacterium]